MTFRSDRNLRSQSSAVTSPFFISLRLALLWGPYVHGPLCSPSPSMRAITEYDRENPKRPRSTHLMHNISIRCCSARLFSLLTFRCNAAKIVRLSSSATPHARFNSLSSTFPIPFLSTPARAPGVVILKYSSSSRRTMMACLDSRGLACCCDSAELELWPAAVPGPGPGMASMRFFWAWKRPGEVGVP